MFYSAIAGWLMSIADVFNSYALPRIWDMNGLDRNLMPRFMPDMPQRLDLDSLGNFIKSIAAAGMPLFPDEELESWVRDAAGMPLFDEMSDEDRQMAIDVAISSKLPGSRAIS